MRVQPCCNWKRSQNQQALFPKKSSDPKPIQEIQVAAENPRRCPPEPEPAAVFGKPAAGSSTSLETLLPAANSQSRTRERHTDPCQRSTIFSLFWQKKMSNTKTNAITNTKTRPFRFSFLKTFVGKTLRKNHVFCVCQVNIYLPA